ncbi:hypothetical protein PVAP13_9NG068693 [Panicum virgatum]|uniref:Thioredoxin domain-containing protein n=1 Tax=Panicum virgatum TaxID=38727 RepID=A0A8T0MCA4_PANVG|nr:hypothetical protein PVAP13_9NG068693 [Panicum virgatum]
MGSFFSTMFTPPPADDPNSAVVAAHSKAAYDQHWEAAKSSGKLMVIDFSASWCGPCRFIEPAFKEMASRYTDVVFVKIDVDELADVARTWKVEAMPTFVLAKGGKEEHVACAVYHPLPEKTCDFSLPEKRLCNPTYRPPL